MPSGVYPRTEKHKEISSKGGLASPTKFKKGHVVTKDMRYKISKTKTQEVVTNHRYSRVRARRKMGLNKEDSMIVHHLDGNPFNNDIHNLITLSRSDHTKLHWAQGDITKHGK